MYGIIDAVDELQKENARLKLRVAKLEEREKTLEKALFALAPFENLWASVKAR
jgi:chaperonin cofactor prefoldin